MSEKQITMYGCINILDTAVEVGLIHKDPNNSDNIIKYFEASEDGLYPEGFYSCNLMSQAEELYYDKESQDFLINEIRKSKPDYTPPIMPDFFMDEYSGNGKLFILTGMSASGKDTALGEMINEHRIKPVISATTRPKREGEQDGVDYNFMSEEKFKRGIEQDAFLEYRAYKTTVDDKPVTWFYGSPKEELSPYKDYAKVLDMQGAEKFVDFYGKENCFVVNFQADDATRESRASGRGSFDKVEWGKRLADDKEKFSDEIVDSIANFIVLNEECTIDSLVSDIIMASQEYFTAAEKEPDKDFVVIYSNNPDKLFNAVERSEYLACKQDVLEENDISHKSKINIDLD